MEKVKPWNPFPWNTPLPFPLSETNTHLYTPPDSALTSPPPGSCNRRGYSSFKHHGEVLVVRWSSWEDCSWWEWEGAGGRRSEVKWVVAITEGLMDHSKAFTMNALGPWEVWAWPRILLAPGWLRQKQGDSTPSIRINPHLVYAPQNTCMDGFKQANAFISSVYVLVDP